MNSDDINHFLGIGFKVDLKSFDKKFRVSVPPISHKEDRYDQKTGKLLPEKEVVVDDEGGQHWKLRNKVFDEFEVFIDALVKELRCDYGFMGFPSFEDDLDNADPEPILYLTIKVRGQSDDGDGIEAIPWPANPLKIHHELQRLKKACRHYGFKVGKPEIVTLLEVCS